VPAVHRAGVGLTVRVALLGGFRLLAGNDVLSVSGGSERLLAFVDLHRQAVGRLLVAGTLWSEVSEGRSYASLRSALARLDRASRKTLQVCRVWAAAALPLSRRGGDQRGRLGTDQSRRAW
jgi:SARP family transcriptional regulator, regulator of embCAB operon